MAMIEVVKNIIPTIIEWATGKTPEYSHWEFGGCGEYGVFDMGFQDSVDFEKACEDKVIGIITKTPFDGHYSSDEVHDYQPVYFLGNVVALTHKVADRSDRYVYWIDSEKKYEMMTYLLKNYPKIDASGCEILSEEVSEKISSSFYQNYIKIDGTLFAMILNPSWGNLSGNGSEKILKVEDGFVIVHGTVVERIPVMRNVKFNNISSFNVVDYYQLVLDNGETFSTKELDQSETSIYMYAKQVEIS